MIMKSPDLLAKAQEHRGYARSLEERARALQQAENLRFQAQSLMAQADQIEGAQANHLESEQGDDSEQAPVAAAGVGWPDWLHFPDPYSPQS